MWQVFILAYGFNMIPTADTLSLFVIFRLRNLTSNSVVSELAGLAWHFKTVDSLAWATARSSIEVQRAIVGGTKRAHHVVERAVPLPVERLVDGVARAARASSAYDDFLWGAMVVVAFFTAARAQEVCTYDEVALRTTVKLVKRSSTVVNDSGFTAFLPFHKSDRLYTGSHLWFASSAGNLFTVIRVWLRARDHLFPDTDILFLRANGATPTRRWFVDKLKSFCGAEYAGHSLRAGGATFYALRGASDAEIMRIGRWVSTSWAKYVRVRPELAIALRTRTINGFLPLAAPAFDDSALLPFL